MTTRTPRIGWTWLPALLLGAAVGVVISAIAYSWGMSPYLSPLIIGATAYLVSTSARRGRPAGPQR